MESQYSIKIIMESRGLRFKDLSGAVSEATLSYILQASRNAGREVLNKIDVLLKTNGAIHWLYALDRLHYLAKPQLVYINPESVIFPRLIDAGIKYIIKKHHPIFKDYFNYIEPFKENQYKNEEEFV